MGSAAWIWIKFRLHAESNTTCLERHLKHSVALTKFHKNIFNFVCNEYFVSSGYIMYLEHAANLFSNFCTQLF